MAIKATDLQKARSVAAKQLDEAKQSFVKAVAPKLDDSQSLWIATHLLNNPATFDLAVKKLGSGAVDDFLRRHAAKG